MYASVAEIEFSPAAQLAGALIKKPHRINPKRRIELPQFDKPADLDEAARHLRALRGKTHELATSVSVLRDEVRLWHHNETPRLTARPFSDAFIADYLALVGPAALESVGAYQLEGPGAQLFSRVEGDFFSILGLPLLPLMAFLREHGVLG